MKGEIAGDTCRDYVEGRGILQGVCMGTAWG